MKQIGTLYVDGKTLRLNLTDPIDGIPGTLESAEVGCGSFPARSLASGLVNLGKRLAARLNREQREVPRSTDELVEAMAAGMAAELDPQTETPPGIARQLVADAMRFAPSEP